MAATNYTPIQLYHSTTASAAPTAGNLVNGELAINITDGKLYYKDDGGVVQILATKGTAVIGGSNTQVQYNSSGAFAGSANMTFDGTSLTVAGLVGSGAVTFSATTQTIAIGTSQTTGVVNIGAAAQTGALTVGQSTKTQTVNVASGATESAQTKTLNIGTAGVAGSTTTITVGSTSGTTTTINGAITAAAVTENIALGTSQTTGTLTAGGTAATGTITVDQSTKTHTLNVGSGATENAATKTVNIATGGVSGSTTTITIGSSNGTSTTLNGTVTAATLNSTTIDTTNLEVTNVKAKDGTAAITLADSTGVATLSANPILNAGTANGVVYLNASKSATTGSALTFSGSVLKVYASGDSDLQLTTTTTGTGASDGLLLRINSTGTEAYLWNLENGILSFGTNSSEKMRLTSTGTLNIVGAGTAGSTQAVSINGSTPVDTLVTTSGGNVGIGTNAPAYKLDVDGAINTSADLISQGNNARLSLYRSSGINYFDWASGQSLYFSTQTSSGGAGRDTKMVLDSSGNLGLGVTPSAWNSTKAMQLGLSGAVFGDGQTLNWTAGLAMNAYGVASGASRIWKRISSEPAYLYQMANGGGSAVNGHAWYIGPSGGSAGDTISFTQAMTLDASGNLVIGDPSASYRLDVKGSTGNGIAYRDGTVTNYLGTTGSNLGYLGTLTNHPVAFLTNATERARISSDGTFRVKGAGTAGSTDAVQFSGSAPASSLLLDSSGNLGIGGSPTYQLDLITGSGNDPTQAFYRTTSSAGFGIGRALFDAQNSSSTRVSYARIQAEIESSTAGSHGGRIIFSTTGSGTLTERARITSGGYFKASNAGTYAGATSVYHELRSSNQDYTVLVTNTSASPYGIYVGYDQTPNGTGNSFLHCLDGTALRAEIRSNGGLANYSANDVNLSDARLKTDITPVASYWDKIKSLEIVSFKYKDQTDDIANIGVIAQQVEAVAPEFVSNDGFGEVPEGEAPYKTIYTTDMYHAAIKALQEAMARIETLEAEVAALKGA